MNSTVEESIIIIRGQRVILDSDLAIFYSVTTKRLNEQVRRNVDRFPEDFMFKLTIQEVRGLRSQFATSNINRGGRRHIPYAFTEHGAVMAANILNSKIAVRASIMLVRTFIRMRTLMGEHEDLKKRMYEIERKMSQGFAQHEQELQEIRFLIAQLEKPIEPKRRQIGFARDDER